jgi:hypothetical protein
MLVIYRFGLRLTLIGICAYKKDEDGAKFYLVTGKPPKYTVRGWLLAKDGKRPEFWGSIGKGGVIDPNGTYRPAYWVPQDKLNIGD